MWRYDCSCSMLWLVVGVVVCGLVAVDCSVVVVVVVSGRSS